MLTRSSTILIHIVTWNSSSYISQCLERLAEAIKVLPDLRIALRVTDNNSSDNTVKLIRESALFRAADWQGDAKEGADRGGALKIFENFGPASIIENQCNLGFAAAHNQGATFFCASDYDYLLILNPDVGLIPEGLRALVIFMNEHPECGSATGKLLRADSVLRPIYPPIIDSTGIIFDRSLRHFDRGGEQLDQGQFSAEEEIDGASGAYLVVRRQFVDSVSFRAQYDEDLVCVFPQLAEGRESRIQLFDEAFFAYREDADLAWRASLLGWRCGYSPIVVGAHVRKVTQHRRASLDKDINCAGVRNRFLLQINNFSFVRDWRSILPGLIFRNLVVIAGVLLMEWGSVPAFRQCAMLFRRARARRRFLWCLRGRLKAEQLN